MTQEILLLQHSHYDRGYMHAPHIEDALQCDFLRCAIQQSERFPEFKWTAEVTRPITELIKE